MEPILYTPIGRLRTPLRTPAQSPVQPAGGRDIEGSAELEDRFADALTDLDGFSHVILLYHFDRVGPYRPRVKPFLDDREHGLFAVRAPARPNPIGLSVVELLGVDGAVCRLRGLDMLDGTPLLDIKPYVPAFDQPPGPIRVGWLAGAADRARAARADDRFSAESDCD
jgi:tRNA-Thr(GGU) m(6)t(6)A37 methyltransferase TsaA